MTQRKLACVTGDAEFIPKNDQDVAQSLIAVAIEGPPSIAEDVK